MCEQARWTQAGTSPVMRCKKIFCGKQRKTYFYLALGKYGSYHRDTSSYVENSILYKVLTNLMFWASKFGYKLGQVSTLQTRKNETCSPYWSGQGCWVLLKFKYAILDKVATDQTEFISFTSKSYISENSLFYFCHCPDPVLEGAKHIHSSQFSCEKRI
jgi:hypothetical protein